MAIYHASVKVIGRSAGHSSVAAAAYRAGSKLCDSRRGVTHDYSKKSGVDHTYIIAPKGAPDWVSNREQLWNAVEAVERRKDAQLCRELEVALPIELDKGDQRRLIYEFANKTFVDQGMVADVALHDLDSHNPHAHILLTMRRLDEGAFGKKERAWNDTELLLKWRRDWAEWVNAELKKIGSSERVDERSYAERGIQKVATKHLGKSASAMEKRGQATKIGVWNRKIRAANDSYMNLSAKVAHVLRFRRLSLPRPNLNKITRTAYRSVRLSPVRAASAFHDWLLAGYWLMVRKKVERELQEKEELRRSSKWVEAYSCFVDMKGNNVEIEIERIKSVLDQNEVQFKVKQKFRASSGYSPAGTMISVKCREIDRKQVNDLLTMAISNSNAKRSEISPLHRSRRR